MNTLITAHSGCDGTADNSLAYLLHAVCTPADAFEVDVQRNADGGLYLSHDPSSNSCPDLSVAFSLAKENHKLINCDLKADGLEADVLALAKQFDIVDQLYFSGSVSLSALRESDTIRDRTLFNITPILPNVIAHYRQGVLPTDAQWVKAVQFFKEYRISTINIPFELCSVHVIEMLHSHKINISAWTVDDQVIACRLLDCNIFNITTRDPAALCALRDRL